MEDNKVATRQEKRVTKVIDGNVKTKTNKVRKLTDTFVAEDLKTVTNFAVTDVVVPALKEMFFKVVKDGLEMFLFGNRGRSNSRSGVDSISYRNYYDKPAQTHSVRNSSRMDYEDIIFDSRGQAERVIMEMENVIRRYGYVTVADMFDMVELTAPYTGNKYGWTSVQHAEPVRLMGGGYVIKLPKAMPID